ncbi:hypothetical protein [Rhizobium sp. BK376]|uniref:hypothetical protein n=1 Tax=Rhizobium sp. BK376 TaxID=2512149 RepID=UPI00104ECB30|nr:hypothetical protein [Rhizobium sp. BK376]
MELKIKQERWRIFQLNAKVIGKLQGASLMAYCGLYGGQVIAGYGRWRDTITPYAYAIVDFLDLVGDARDEPASRLCVLPKNKGVDIYLTNHAPLWRERGINGHHQVPEAKDEWIRASTSLAEQKFSLTADYKAFKEDARKIDRLLNKIGTIAERQQVKEGPAVRLPRGWEAENA